MTLFWIVTAALSLAVALLLARALLRGRRDTGPAQAFDIQVYRDQLKDVERDLARGVIEAGDAERVRTEISRRILAADSAMRAQGGEALEAHESTPPPPRGHRARAPSRSRQSQGPSSDSPVPPAR